MAILVHKKKTQNNYISLSQETGAVQDRENPFLSVLVVELHPEEVPCVALVDVVDYVLVV